MTSTIIDREVYEAIGRIARKYGGRNADVVRQDMILSLLSAPAERAKVENAAPGETVRLLDLIPDQTTIGKLTRMARNLARRERRAAGQTFERDRLSAEPTDPSELTSESGIREWQTASDEWLWQRVEAALRGEKLVRQAKDVNILTESGWITVRDTSPGLWRSASPELLFRGNGATETVLARVRAKLATERGEGLSAPTARVLPWGIDITGGTHVAPECAQHREMKVRELTVRRARDFIASPGTDNETVYTPYQVKREYGSFLSMYGEAQKVVHTHDTRVPCACKPVSVAEVHGPSFAASPGFTLSDTILRCPNGCLPRLNERATTDPGSDRESDGIALSGIGRGAVRASNSRKSKRAGKVGGPVTYLGGSKWRDIGGLLPTDHPQDKTPEHLTIGSQWERWTANDHAWTPNLPEARHAASNHAVELVVRDTPNHLPLGDIPCVPRPTITPDLTTDRARAAAWLARVSGVPHDFPVQLKLWDDPQPTGYARFL